MLLFLLLLHIYHTSKHNKKNSYFIMPPPRRSTFVSASSLEASRFSTIIGSFFIVVALCSIALVIGGELYIQFHNSSPTPSSYVVAGIYPPQDFATRNTSYGPLNALLASFHPSEMQCPSSSSSIFHAMISSLSDLMNVVASSGVF